MNLSPAANEKIFIKVSRLWSVILGPTKDFLLETLPHKLKQKDIWIYGNLVENEFSDINNLAEYCLSPTMKKKFQSVQSCEDIYVLLTIMGEYSTKKSKSCPDGNLKIKKLP